MIDLPREMGMAWNTPVGLRLYSRKASKNGRTVAIVDGAQDRVVLLDVVGFAIEDTSEVIDIAAGRGLDLAIGHQELIDFRAQLMNHGAQLDAAL